MRSDPPRLVAIVGIRDYEHFMGNAILILHLALAMLLLWLIVKDQIQDKRGLAVTCALALLASGAYNFMTRMAGAPKGWHIFIGIKTLLALHVIVMVLLIARGHDDPDKLERWRRSAFFTSVVTILIGMYYSNFAG